MGKKEKADMIFLQEKVHNDEPMYRAGIEMHTWRTDLWAQQEKERVGQIERVVLTYIQYHA